MSLTEKVSYIKGMADGMQFDTATNEGKLIVELLALCGEMAQMITDLDSDVESICDELEAIDADLTEIEEVLFEDEDYDDEEDEDETFYEVTCPNCEEVVCLGESMLDEEFSCPSCGTAMELAMEDDEDEGEQE